MIEIMLLYCGSYEHMMRRVILFIGCFDDTDDDEERKTGDDYIEDTDCQPLHFNSV